MNTVQADRRKAITMRPVFRAVARLGPIAVMIAAVLTSQGFEPPVRAFRGLAAFRQQEGGTSQPETLMIDTQLSGRPFPHFWERMFGSGRAILSLRESYRQDLRAVKAVTDFEYVRFHAILSDEVGIAGSDPVDPSHYNFSYVDQIYDGLLDNGVRPFVELSFMPKRLAAEEILHPFWYKPVVSPPRDWAQWGDLMTRLAEHLVERYGIDEVSQWYFEVWNEPNLDFWAGNPQEATYYQLYDTSARALKSVNARLRVGGPATAQAAWVDRFIRHTADQQVPVDFVSTHVYGNDSAHDVFGTNEIVPLSDMVCRAARKVAAEVRESPRPRLPIIWSEFNASYKTEPEVTDSVFMGPWLANTIRQCDGLATFFSYWTFSDVFEEQGVVERPFYGGYGLLAERGLPKPAFNAFKVLHRLGDTRLPVDADDALVTRRADGTIVVAVWNYGPPGARGSSKDVTLVLGGAPTRTRAFVSRVDETHGSLQAVYQRMGHPAYPTQKQIQALRQAATLGAPEEHTLQHGAMTLRVPFHGLAVVAFPVSGRLP